MHLYLLEQTVNNTWETYNSCIVCATSEAAARLISPGSLSGSDWCNPDEVVVTRIGKAAEHILPETVVLASYNAG